MDKLIKRMRWYLKNVYHRDDNLDDSDTSTICTDMVHLIVPDDVGFAALLDAARDVEYTGLVYLLYFPLRHRLRCKPPVVYYCFHKGIPVCQWENLIDGEEPLPGEDWARAFIEACGREGVNSDIDSFIESMVEKVKTDRKRYFSK